MMFPFLASGRPLCLVLGVSHFSFGDLFLMSKFGPFGGNTDPLLKIQMWGCSLERVFLTVW